jgi:hypothetical protein
LPIGTERNTISAKFAGKSRAHSAAIRRWRARSVYFAASLAGGVGRSHSLASASRAAPFSVTVGIAWHWQSERLLGRCQSVPLGSVLMFRQWPPPTHQPGTARRHPHQPAARADRLLAGGRLPCAAVQGRAQLCRGGAGETPIVGRTTMQSPLRWSHNWPDMLKT